jgi:hypothetical protein
MDDFSWSANTVRLTGDERSSAILEALRAHSLKAALFVRGSNIDNDGGKALLSAVRMRAGIKNAARHAVQS